MIPIDHIAKAKRDFVASEKCKGSLLFFTRYFFKARFGRKFVVNSHHEEICNALERVHRGECTRLIINIAPRYGKTELAVKNFVAWSLANNPSARFIHLSYSDSLALDNSEEVRDIIAHESYQQLFPVKTKQDSNSKKKWYTTESGGVYATSTGGQVTGFGAGKVDDEDLNEIEKFGGAIIIDDPIKPEDGESDTIRERINQRFDSTIRNRVNSRNTPIIIIMQRVHPQDLCGHLIENDSEDWEVLSLPCLNEQGEALWPFKHTVDELGKMRAANPTVFDRQYMQNPKPKEGLMYNQFLTYKELPAFEGLVSIENYTDTADTGSDYLCSPSYIVKDNLAYLIDVVYTPDAMEVTEVSVSSALTQNKVSVSHIESNNGGRMFARMVDKLCKGKVVIKWFHQSKNKQVRIFNARHAVEKHIIYPHDWHVRWPKFHHDMTNYMASGKNAHDDAPDAVTGIIEKSLKTVHSNVATSGKRVNKPRHNPNRL